MTTRPDAAPLELLLESEDLPTDRLHVRRAVLREAISRLFELDLDVVSDADGFDLDAAAGAEIALVILRDGFEIRRVHGMIAEIADPLDSESDLRNVRLRVVPRAHRLALVDTQEIFLGLTVPEIVKQKIAAVGLGDDVEMRLAATYAKEELKVQYRESDLAFVSRITEHLGVSFFVEHHDGRDVLVFTDHAEGFRAIEGAAKVPFRRRGEKRDVFRLEARRRVVPGFYAVRDYDDQKPQLDITAMNPIEGGYGGGVIELGTHHRTPAEGVALARIRAEEVLAGALAYEGESDVPGLSAGARVTIEDHPRLGSIDLLLVEVEHRVTQAVAGTANTDEPLRYTNTFRAIPADRMYRPPRVTSKPRIAGLVTGIIHPGPNGDPTFAQLDEQGRYTVRFLFDTTAPGERPASSPLRMAQPHAGAGYGLHFPLKPGTEVVIGFLDGDPDRPIIVGAVPNPITPSPVDRSSARVHRIRTQTGIVFDLVDGS